MLYLNIETDVVQFTESKNTKIINKILSFFIPIANPDFDDKIFFISNWFLEFDNENSIPNREIGLNSEGEVILKMPYKENCGYWVDNNLTYNDFKETFKYKIIDEEIFQKKWIML